jgi:hypothetical protein
MFCICNEKYMFNKLDYYIPRNFSMEYKRYSIENNKIINEMIEELIEKVNTTNSNIEIKEIKENYFEYNERELNEDYVSTGYFNVFLNIGNYLNKLNHV